MSTNIITGWLNDDNGEKFAPKTLSTQVLMSDGNNLENKIKNIGGGSTEITIIKDGVETTLNGMRINQYDTKDEYDEATKIDGEFYSYPDGYDEALDTESTNAIQNAAVANAINLINEKIEVIKFKDYGLANGNTSTTIETGDGLFLVVAWQGGSLTLCGIALVCVTGYTDGCFVSKIAGGSLFNSNLTFTVNASNKSFTVNNTHVGGFHLSSYKLA